MKKKVYVCAPLGGNVAENIERAKRYTEYALRSGVAPIVTHFYAFCLDDNNPKDREIGMSAGIGLLWFCDELWIFGKEITAGMQEEIKFCKDFRIPVRKISDGEIKKILGGTKNDQKENSDRIHCGGNPTARGDGDHGNADARAMRFG